ncbi:hypothetical protein [Helicobacter sp. 23-1045]
MAEYRLDSAIFARRDSAIFVGNGTDSAIFARRDSAIFAGNGADSAIFAESKLFFVIFAESKIRECLFCPPPICHFKIHTFAPNKKCKILAKNFNI